MRACWSTPSPPTSARLIALHNFTDVPVTVSFGIGQVEPGTALIDLLGPERVDVDEKARAAVELAPYGCRWLRVSPPGDTRIG